MRLFFLFIFSFIFLYSYSNNFDPKISDGIIDLSSYDFESNGPVRLNANWEFYWKKFITVSDSVQPDGYWGVSKHWDKFKYNGEPIGSIGYGTYRIKLIFPSYVDRLAIDISTVSSSALFFLNNKILTSIGTVNRQKEFYKPAIDPQIVELEIEHKENVLIIQVANFDYARGGLWESMTIGLPKDIIKQKTRRTMLFYVLFGAIFMMSLYHAGLFLLRRKEVSALYFFLWTFVASVYLLFSGKYYPITDFYPFGYSVINKIEYLSYYLSVPLFIIFVYDLFRVRFNRYILYVLVGFGFVMSLLVLFTKSLFFSATVHVYQVFTVLSVVYLTYVLIVAMVKKDRGATLLLISFIVLSLAIINDISVVNNYSESKHFVLLGIFVFVLMQAYLLSSRLVGAFGRIEVLSRKLNFINMHLERIVDDRTEKLKLTNIKLQEKNEKISSQSNQLQQMNRQLLKLSNALSETDNAIIIISKEGNVDWINHGFERLYGYSLDEMKKVFGVNLKKSKSTINRADIFEKVSKEKKAHHYESVVISKSGEEIDVQTTLSPIIDEEGEVLYYISVDTDIRKLKQTQKELSKSNSAKNKLFSIIAHDLKNPFNAILGFTELILTHKENLEKNEIVTYVKELNVVSKNTYHLLINLLDWSRYQSDRIVLNPENYIVRSLIDGVAAQLMANFSKKKIAFENNVPIQISAFFDLRSIETVIRNLLSNAIKFTSAGGKVEVNASVKDNVVEIFVKDNGVGIAPEFAEAFHCGNGVSTPGTESEQGTGLGLILCKYFTEKNNGTIKVGETSSNGTTFIVALPAASEKNSTPSKFSVV